MNSFLSAVFALTAALGTTTIQDAQAQSTSSAVAPQVDPAITARAKEWLHRLQTGDIDRTQLDSAMDSLLTPATIKQIMNKFGALGEPVSFTYVGQQIVQDNTAYVYRAVFTSGTYNEVFVLNKQGKISGFQLPPAPQ